MISRFEGPDGKRCLAQLLLRQDIVQGDHALADAIVDIAKLRSFIAGDVLITQGASDTEIFLILAGGVEIEVNGRRVATRTAKQHVGEMALIDPSQPRSATVRALGETVVAILPEPAVTHLGESFPLIWRRIALELADRLRQRSRFHVQPNAETKVFIGCASESLSAATEIQSALRGSVGKITLWADDFFKPGDTTIDRLLVGIGEADFAVFVLGKDDVTISRKKEQWAPRDNVIFELGLAMGQMGRERALIVQENGIKLPSDMLGLTTLRYSRGGSKPLSAKLSRICDEIRTRIKELGPK